MTMTESTLKPRLVTPSQRSTVSTFPAPATDVRFAALVADHHRQRQMLTPRELEVLALLCEGLPNKLIERRLGIGAGTVKCHVANILSKLGVASRLQAVIEAHRRGLLTNRDTEREDQDDETVASLAGPAAYEAPRRFAGMGRARE
jgi:DNA-binding NarL/FixJ family response regulator